ncbi:putative auxin efflux carrier superfamily protein [Neofusicoccum parvum UCRNP2]|uniref:Putative auxin efflux carrier superfamily protein n=1 Tax=Botryosphaeria parva (strain UCR-NP2) TaxID=1287680 RepID=R1GWI8_BOTPV|nr:putative auxin efflux carrier superfamily protein [Neofusicoccum parvum UCRNP2]
MLFKSHRLLQQAVPDFATMANPSDPSSFATGLLDVMNNHSSHPDFGHLCLLVFEAVMEVVCVSLPGYIVARQGMFDANAQKFVANLNVQLFTPCLIFTKLASQLTADKLVDLAIIPAIFVVQTFVSWGSAIIVARLFGFKKQRPRNFITAMAVFGNSNSLPISLVLSLSKTIQGLHWSEVPGDNDDEVGARGILYLLIFQQLGQLVRWSWGYQVLLKPASEYPDEDAGRTAALEQGDFDDASSIERRNLLEDDDDDHDDELRSASPVLESSFASGAITPVNDNLRASTDVSRSSSTSNLTKRYANDGANGKTTATPTNGNVVVTGPGNLAGHAAEDDSLSEPEPETPKGYKGWPKRSKLWMKQKLNSTCNSISATSKKAFEALPSSVQKVLSKIASGIRRFLNGVWDFMNPPLWAMLVALIVASVPPLQHLFFDPGSFVNNSVTRAVKQSGGVAVPLILVVLGANLAKNTLPEESAQDIEDKKDEKKLLYASLISRMLLPTIIMAPILALLARYAPVSIIADPIFMIVCFLLSGAPSALQLAQICQLNNVYMGAMSKLLFQSYVVWILPSTLMLVMLALETVEWSTSAYSASP